MSRRRAAQIDGDFWRGLIGPEAQVSPGHPHSRPGNPNTGVVGVEAMAPAAPTSRMLLELGPECDVAVRQAPDGSLTCVRCSLRYGEGDFVGSSLDLCVV